tara:strand:+ start:248 stop:496 length:249 start_codon:yes stop_codon:yes gene_type:complete
MSLLKHDLDIYSITNNTEMEFKNEILDINPRSNFLKNNAGIKSNSSYRKYLIHNTDMILNTNQQMCKNECGFINTNTKSKFK